MRPRWACAGRSVVAMVLLFPLATACAGAHEDAARREASSPTSARPLTASRPRERAAPALSGALGGYVAYAMGRSPELRADYERWQASVYRIAPARKLPEPTVSFGFFLRSVETRVGPQIAKLSVSQSVPWPGTLTAKAEAASSEARAKREMFEARAIEITQRIEDAYWALWLVRSARRRHAEHLEVMRSLSISVRARIATGAATLADAQQLDLQISRVEDALAAMTEGEQAASAALRALIDAPRRAELPTTDDPPPPQLPTEQEAALAEAAKTHPLLTSLERMAEAQESVALSKERERYPGLTVSGDWIFTGAAAAPGLADSGKDAVMVGAGLRVPIWQGTYLDGARAARGEASSKRAERAAATLRAVEQVTKNLSAVRDATRRVRLHERTLVPQSDAAYESVLGAFVAGRAGTSQILMAQRDLLDLRVDLDRARADYARAWARLERAVGRPVARARAEQPAVPPGGQP